MTEQPRKEAPAKKKATAKATKTAPSLPPFDKLDTAALTALAGTLNKTFDEFDVDKKLVKAVGDERKYPLLVHLITHGAVAPQAGTVGALLRQMRYASEVAVPGLVEWVGQLPKTSKAFYNHKSVSSGLLPAWDHPMQDLAAQALLRDADGFVAAASKWKQANLRLGAHFLLGVSGHTVPAAIAADILKAIAGAEAGSPPFRPQFAFVTSGALKSWNIISREDARAVALHFGDAAAWDTTLATAMVGGDWIRVRDVPVPVLAGLPLDALMTILLAENRHPGDDPEALFAVLEARNDEIIAIANAARALGSESGAERLLREVLLVWTLKRGLDRGQAPTVAQVRELRDFGQQQVYAPNSPDVHRPLREAYDAIFSSLQRDDALAIAEERLDAGLGGLVAILRSHLDAALLQRAANNESATSLMTLGRRALPGLVEALLQTPPMWRLSKAKGRVVVVGTDTDGREVYVVDTGNQVFVSDGIRSADTPWGTVAESITMEQAQTWLAAAAAQHATKMEQRAACIAALDGRSFDSTAGTLSHAIHGILAAGSGPLEDDECAAVDHLGSAVLQLGLSWGHPELTAGFLRRLDADERQRLLQHAIEIAAKPQRAFAFAALMSRAGRVAFTRTMFERRATAVHDEGFDAGLRAVGPEQVAEATAGIDLDTATMQRLQRAFGPQRFEQFSKARGVASRTWLQSFDDLVREHGGRSEPVYVLEFEYHLQGVPSPRSSTSWSVVDGDGPGITAPTALDGDAMEHVLTLDLQELPLLRPRYPGARAISLYMPSKSSGHYEQGRIVAVDDGASPPTGGQPLHVFAVEVPSEVFNGGTSSTAQAAWRLLWQRAGWCLGGPIGIQGEVDIDDFVMQLFDRIGISLGDGALYVAGSGKALMHGG